MGTCPFVGPLKPLTLSFPDWHTLPPSHPPPPGSNSPRSQPDDRQIWDVGCNLAVTCLNQWTLNKAGFTLQMTFHGLQCYDERWAISGSDDTNTNDYTSIAATMGERRICTAQAHPLGGCMTSSWPKPEVLPACRCGLVLTFCNCTKRTGITSEPLPPG